TNLTCPVNVLHDILSELPASHPPVTSPCTRRRRPGKMPPVGKAGSPHRLRQQEGTPVTGASPASLAPSARPDVLGGLPVRPRPPPRRGGAPPSPPLPATARRPLARRTPGRHHPRIRVRPPHGLPRPRGRGPLPQGRQLRPRPAAVRRLLVQLPRRPPRT